MSRATAANAPDALVSPESDESRIRLATGSARVLSDARKSVVRSGARAAKRKASRLAVISGRLDPI